MKDRQKIVLLLTGILVAALILGFSWRTLKSTKSSGLPNPIELFG